MVMPSKKDRRLRWAFGIVALIVALIVACVFAIVVLIVAPNITHTVTEEPLAPLLPDTLPHWLQIIDADEYRLLYAVDQNGYFFAVKQDRDGDILFCKYRHGPANEKSPDHFSLTVSGLDDEALFDWDSKKKSPPTAKIEYSTNKNVGPIKLHSSSTVAYSRGELYPMRDHDLPTLRITYHEVDAKGAKKVLFDQVVRLPKKDGEMKKGHN